MLSIGIDIGSFSVKVAKVRSTNKGYELITASEYPLGQDPSKDNQIEIVEILRDVHTRIWEEGAHMVIGAHQYEVSWRRREFPFRERHKILKSLPFELEDDIPFSADNSVFDAKITHYVGNKANVLAIACPKDHLEAILKRFEDAGQSVDHVSVDGIAFANLFEEWREAPWSYPAVSASAQELPQETTAVDLAISIGHKTSTVAVIKDGYLLDLRFIDWGGKDLAETIGLRYSMNYLEALKSLKKNAFILTTNDGSSREQVALSEVIKSAVYVFAQKLQLQLLDLKSLYKIEFRQGILVGGLSQIRNLGAYLTQRTDVAMNRLAKLDMMPQIDFGQSPNSEVSLATAIGLAIEGVKRPKNPAINLLRGDFAKQSQSLRVMWEKWSHTAITATVAFVLVVGWAMLRDDFAQSNVDSSVEVLNKQAKDILGAKGPKITERSILAFIKDQEEKVKLREMLEGLQNVNSPMDIMKKLASLAPVKKQFGSNHDQTGLNVTDLKINGDDMSISGEAATAELLTDFERALTSVARDGKLQKQPTTAVSKSNYRTFRYQLKVERKSGA